MYLTVLDLKYTKYEHQVQVQVQVLLNFKTQVPSTSTLEF